LIQKYIFSRERILILRVKTDKNR